MFFGRFVAASNIVHAENDRLTETGKLQADARKMAIARQFAEIMQMSGYCVIILWKNREVKNDITADS